MARELTDQEAAALGLPPVAQPRELTDQEAAALGLPVAPKAASEPSVASAAASGFAQGGTFGFSDELGAGLQAALGGLPGGVQEALGGSAAGPQEGFLDRYRTARDENRKEMAQQRAAHSGVFTATELAGGLVPGLLLPGAGVARAGGTAARLATGALSAGAGGAAAGAGYSEGKTAGDVLKDAAVGGAVAAPFGAVGAALGQALRAGKVAARTGAGKAIGDASQKAANEADKEIASQLGRYRSSIQSASRDLEVLGREASQTADPTLASKAQAFLSSPEGQNLNRMVTESKLSTAPERIGEMNSAQAQLEALRSGRPGAIQEGAANQLVDALKKQATPRIATLGHRLIPIALTGAGAALGGVPGAAVGGGIGTAMALLQGRPGVIVRNIIRSPGVRHEALAGLAKALSQVQTAGPALSRATDTTVRAIIAKLQNSEDQ